MTWKDLPRNPSATTLRQFGLLCLVCFGALGAWKLAHGSTWAGGTLLTAAGVGGLLGLAWPTALRPVFVGWMIAVFPVGWVVSRTLLAAIYYLVFMPLALWFRLRGRDALRLRKPATNTHWLPKPAPQGAASYYGQF